MINLLLVWGFSFFLQQLAGQHMDLPGPEGPGNAFQDRNPREGFSDPGHLEKIGWRHGG
jgi:hypothetical protein